MLRKVKDSGTYRVTKAENKFITDHDPKLGAVNIVEKMNEQTGQWDPWLLEAQSAGLRNIDVTAYGLYAMRDFSTGDRIGRYGGLIIASEHGKQNANKVQEEVEAYAKKSEGHSILMLKVRRGEDFSYVDGAAGRFAPFLNRVNDPKGIKGADANLEFSEFGCFDAIKDISAIRVHKNLTLEDISSSELFVDYGDDYWDFHDKNKGKASEGQPVIGSAGLLPSLAYLNVNNALV